MSNPNTCHTRRINIHLMSIPTDTSICNPRGAKLPRPRGIIIKLKLTDI